MTEGFMFTVGIILALIVIFLIIAVFVLTIGYKLIAKILDTVMVFRKTKTKKEDKN